VYVHVRLPVGNHKKWPPVQLRLHVLPESLWRPQRFRRLAKARLFPGGGLGRGQMPRKGAHFFGNGSEQVFLGQGEGRAGRRCSSKRLDRVARRHPTAEGFAGKREVLHFPLAQEFAEEVHPSLDSVVDERLVRGAEAKLVERSIAAVLKALDRAKAAAAR